MRPPSGLIACAKCASRAVFGAIATTSRTFEPFVASGSVRGADNLERRECHPGRHGYSRRLSERDAVNTLLGCFKIIPLNTEIAVRGGLFRRDFGKTHGVELADALIAATVESIGCILATLNRKHYPMLSSVTIPYTKS